MEIGNSLTADNLTVNATSLRHDEYLKYDDALLKVARQRLRAVADLKSRGLIKVINNWGTLVSKYERLGDMTAAHVDMDGATRGQNDRLTYDEVSIPIPIIHKDWTISSRQLASSRNRGEPIDTLQMEVAGRICMDTLERSVFHGFPGLKADGGEAYGYLTHPDRNPVSISNWKTSTDKVIDDVLSMINAAYDDNKFGPYMMYVSTNFWPPLLQNYSDQHSERNFVERLLAIPDINMVAPADYMPDNTVLMIQMSTETVDLAIAKDFTNLKYNMDPMIESYTTYGAMVPRVKSDRNGHCGIVHGSVA